MASQNRNPKNLAARGKGPFSGITWINPRFQLTFIAYGLAIALLSAIGTAVLLRSAANPGDAGPGRAMIVAIVTLSYLFSIMIGLLLSHRAAGPIYRLARHMEEASRADSPILDFNLRKKDFFQEVCLPYNVLIEELRSRRSKEAPPTLKGDSA